MKPRHQRLAWLVVGLGALGVAAALVLNALNGSIALFVTPSEIASGRAPHAGVFRLGGLVKAGSLQRDGMTAHFVVTDTAREVPVVFTGILPDLFREGRGVVAQGRITADGSFDASEVLAKHDENYMPPEAKHALEQAHQTERTLQP